MYVMVSDELHVNMHDMSSPLGQATLEVVDS
jgi:hypothetical protein